jgi:hypothetical protein
LLCGMEQARRSALAHHVHRTAPMGPRVLINGIWYKGTEMREHVLLFCLLGLVLTATIILVIAPAATWALALIE